jgi:hypothetical protein
MTGDEKSEPYFLRLNVPFDVERPEDARFVKELEAIPNGLKAALVRLLLLRALPKQKEELQDLLAAAYHDQQGRGRVRGRPRTAEQRKLVARAAEVDALSGQPESIKVVAPVGKVKVVVSVTPVASMAAVVEGDAESGGDALQQYTGLLGTSKW